MKPYVYKLERVTTGELYIGFRSFNVTEKRSASDDIMVKYFTSSDRVRSIIEREGVSAFKIIEIIECDSKDDAFALETKMIKGSLERGDKLLNLHVTGNFIASCAGSDTMKARSRIIRERVYKWITNGIEETRISLKTETVPEGWHFGRIRRNAGKITVNDGTRQRLVKQDAIPAGWVIGQLESSKMKNSAGNKGKAWFTDGVVDKKFVPGSEPPKWYPGRCFVHGDVTKDKIKNTLDVLHETGFWITDGVARKVASRDDAMPNGWWRGSPGRNKGI